MAEFNFKYPEAATIVTASGMPLEFVGWDISITSAIVTQERHDAMLAIGTPRGFGVDIAQAVRRFAPEHGMEGDDLPDPSDVQRHRSIGPETSRLNVWAAFGDGGQRGDGGRRMGLVGGEPNVDIVTHHLGAIAPSSCSSTHRT